MSGKTSLPTMYRCKFTPQTQSSNMRESVPWNKQLSCSWTIRWECRKVWTGLAPVVSTAIPMNAVLLKEVKKCIVVSYSMWLFKKEIQMREISSSNWSYIALTLHEFFCPVITGRQKCTCAVFQGICIAFLWVCNWLHCHLKPKILNSQPLSSEPGVSAVVTEVFQSQFCALSGELSAYMLVCCGSVKSNNVHKFEATPFLEALKASCTTWCALNKAVEGVKHFVVCSSHRLQHYSTKFGCCFRCSRVDQPSYSLLVTPKTRWAKPGSRGEASILPPLHLIKATDHTCSAVIMRGGLESKHWVTCVLSWQCSCP